MTIYGGGNWWQGQQFWQGQGGVEGGWDRGLTFWGKWELGATYPNPWVKQQGQVCGCLLISTWGGAGKHLLLCKKFTLTYSLPRTPSTSFLDLLLPPFPYLDLPLVFSLLLPLSSSLRHSWPKTEILIFPSIFFHSLPCPNLPSFF